MRQIALRRQIVERMLGPRKSHSECEKKQIPLAPPSVDLQLEGVQSANQSVVVRLLQTHCSEDHTIPLKDATSPVHYFE